METIQIMLSRYRFDLFCSIAVAAIAGITLLLFLLFKKKFRLENSLLTILTIALLLGIGLTALHTNDYLTFQRAVSHPEYISTTAELQRIVTSDSDNRFTPQLFSDVTISQLDYSNNLMLEPVAGIAECLELHILTENLAFFLGDSFEFHEGQQFDITYEFNTNTLISISPIKTTVN